MTAKRKKKKAEELEQVEQVEEIQETEQVDQVQEAEELEPVEEPEVEIEVEKPEPVEVVAEKILIGYKVAPGKGVTTRSGMVTGKSKRILQPKDFGQGADCIEKLIELEALVAVYEDKK